MRPLHHSGVHSTLHRPSFVPSYLRNVSNQAHSALQGSVPARIADHSLTRHFPYPRPVQPNPIHNATSAHITGSLIPTSP